MVKHKPYFTKKHVKADKKIRYIFYKKEDIFFKINYIAYIFSEYFRSMVEWLDLPIWNEGSKARCSCFPNSLLETYYALYMAILQPQKII